ncbi:ABC transporter ATP-binding protein [Haloplasma contractile]|uniref:ABC transporter ATP-binding protein n=1 Tax=Haloplasma contractile SSD-17B TaxID=1033810 RepID=U2EB70_9MOLU|nr:ABC transporter ATP-binding protein [Haloplasma contractile]ERJ12026.1 ABC transporter ATP-binding protein [Haloplasma contractile SSD-17B]
MTEMKLSQSEQSEVLSAISIKELHKNFGDNKVLNGIDLEVKQGEIIGYIGPNGAGKSTTVKLILGLIDDYEGEVKILGKDIKGDVDYKRKIGYVPEAADIYDNLTAREYLTFVGELYGMSIELVDKKAFALMDLFGIKDVYDSRMSSFSKGMKQKVLIVSSIIHNPDILFLDEPLSGLDANSVMVVKELLAKQALKGKTIFYSSHIMDVVERISNRIIIINNGKVLADGSFDDLKRESKEGSLEEIFNELTGFKQHKEIAEQMMAIIEEGE